MNLHALVSGCGRQYCRADGTADSNQYIRTWVHGSEYSWADRSRDMSIQDIRIEAICRKGWSYATNDHVFRFQEAWFGKDVHHGFCDNDDDPNDLYNKDGDSDLDLVSSDRIVFQVHTLILSKAS